MSGRVIAFAPPAPDESLPHSIETEQALLGALLLRNDLADEISRVVQPDHLFEPTHAHLYRVALDMIAAGHVADPITMRPYVGDADLGGITVGEYLSRLAGAASSISSAPHYARVIRDLAERRDVIRIADRMAARARNEGIETPSASIIEEAEGELLELRSATPQGHLSGMTAGEAGAFMVERIARIQSGELPVDWISTGFPDLDRATYGGYGRGQLWIVAGRPGMGKTVVLTGLSRAAAGHGGVLAMQFEVPREQAIARYLADLCYIRDRPLKFGDIMKAKDLDEADLWRVRQAAERFGKLNLRLEVQSSATVAQIAFMIRREKKRLAKLGQRLGVVFLDYLKFIKASDRYKGQRFNEVGEITVALKTLAKDEDVCIVLLAQLNRGTEGKDREDRRPDLADLGVSGDLEQDADVVAFLYREAYYLQKKVKANPNDAELSGRLIDKQHHLEFILGKNRAGPQTTIDLFTDIGSSHIAAAQREFY